LAKPCRSIGSFEDCLHLFSGREANERLVEALHRHRERVFDDLGRGYVVASSVFEKWSDSSEASVASPRSILSFPLKVVEKAQDELCIEIGQIKSRWRLALMLLRKRKQKPEGVLEQRW
jgi:hypothetical protein